MDYFVTGATGFIGRHLVERLLEREGEIHVLVRPESIGRLDALIHRWGGAGRIHPVLGDLGKPLLGLDPEQVAALHGTVDHFFHLAAIYDMTADEERDRIANVNGTRHAVELANTIEAGCFHHVSSIAVAGNYKGLFREDMFDEGQPLDHPYHRTKFEAERIAREETTVPWRVYRPAVVVGHSQTGEMDKIDGPYYFFKLIQRLGGVLPSWLPLVAPELGDTNIVPVNYVAAAMDHIAHQPGLDGRAFHLVNPHPQRSADVVNAFARVAHAPRIAVQVDDQLTQGLSSGALSLLMRLPGARAVRRGLLAEVGIPDEVVDHVALIPRFATEETERALDGSGIEVPPLRSYARTLWEYWERNLDPELLKDRSLAGVVNGRTILITGASSGIGRAAALKLARAGGILLLVARSADKLEQVREEIESFGGSAWVYAADVSDPEAIERLLAQVLSDHPAVDVLVNNAGRSIRRSVALSYDRFHDFERTIQLNYLGAVKLILGAAAAHARAQARPHRQRLLDRRADEPAALLRLRRLEGRARRLHARRRLGDDRRPRHLHDDPHAARAHADDRADEALQLVPDDLARRGGRPDLRGDPREAEADQHAPRDDRRGRLRARAEGSRPDTPPRLPRLPRLGRRARRGRRRRGAGLGRAVGARASDAWGALVGVLGVCCTPVAVWRLPVEPLVDWS